MNTSKTETRTVLRSWQDENKTTINLLSPAEPEPPSQHALRLAGKLFTLLLAKYLKR